uniref:Uncharacterized protein n=1 Tax=Anguilla anguilla TaxID=7936 RepID=A0A0E9PWL6_ANGAN
MKSEQRERQHGVLHTDQVLTPR